MNKISGYAHVALNLVALAIPYLPQVASFLQTIHAPQVLVSAIGVALTAWKTFKANPLPPASATPQE